MKKLWPTIVVALCALSAYAQGTMTVTLSGKFIVSTDTRVIEIFDRNCNRSLGQFSLRGNANIQLNICKNGAGYGNVQYRNVTNNGSWIGASQLKAGEEISP